MTGKELYDTVRRHRKRFYVKWGDLATEVQLHWIVAAEDVHDRYLDAIDKAVDVVLGIPTSIDLIHEGVEEQQRLLDEEREQNSELRGHCDSLQRQLDDAMAERRRLEDELDISRVRHASDIQFMVDGLTALQEQLES